MATGGFLQILIGYFESLKPYEIALFFGYQLLFLFSLLAITLFCKIRKISDPAFKASLHAVNALIFIVIAVFAHQKISDPILKLLFRDISISLTAIALAASVYSVSKIHRYWKYLTFIGLLAALAVEIVVIFTTNISLVTFLIPLRKALILLSLYPISLALLELIRLKRLKRLLNLLLAFLFLAVGVLWELNYINFDVRAFIGLATIVVATLLFSWFATHGMRFLSLKLRELQLSDEDIAELEHSLNQLAFAILLYIYWVSTIYFFNFDTLVDKLKEITLVDTEVVRISLYNLLVSFYLFYFLFQLVNVLKKLVKIPFKPQEREDKGGSLEVILYNFGILIAVAVFLSSLGLTWKVILPLAGALGIGLGFGLQTILNNYVSGFIMMFSKNIKVGDFVELSGNAGKFINNPNDTTFGRVEDISILTTRIKTLDGIDILVPNSTFVNSQIVNYSFKNPYVRVRFPFGVAYSSDPKKVKEILLKVAYECPWAKNYYRPPQVWFTEMGDSALIFQLMFWVDIREIWRNPYATLSHGLFDWVNTNAWYKLKEAGIEIPFPQNDIWFRNQLKVVLEASDGKPLAFLNPSFPHGVKEKEKQKGENRKENSQ